jgi:hypothetical protein
MIRYFALTVVFCCCAILACSTPETSSSGSGPTQQLDAAKVPEDLRHLVPLAERWGIGDDVDRNAKVDKASPAEREELRNALAPVSDRITAWLNSFGTGSMPDEAAAFMYMQLALEEMTAGTP